LEWDINQRHHAKRPQRLEELIAGSDLNPRAQLRAERAGGLGLGRGDGGYVAKDGASKYVGGRTRS